MVYGSDDARGMELRTGTNGEMKTSGGGLSLPYNENAFPNAGGDNDPLLFLAGKTSFFSVSVDLIEAVSKAFKHLFLQVILGPMNRWA